MSHFLGYGRQSIDESDIAAVVETLRGSHLTQGPVIERFEAALAERVGARFAIAVSNGTAGLHLACLAAGVGPDQRGVTSALTFVASANCLLYCGGDAGLVDIDPVSLCMNGETLADDLARHENTSVVIPVDFAGLAAHNADIRRIAGTRFVIEDACHALGADYVNGRPVGCGDFADMTVFSFHPVKPITTGEGGAILTNDSELARRLRLLRSHGIEKAAEFLESPVKEGPDVVPWYYEQQFLGFNYRMTDIQAALGLSQLKRLDGFIARRREIAGLYDARFTGLPHVRLPQSDANARTRSGLHLYLIHVNWSAIGGTRAEAMKRLAGRGIGSQVHYIPVYRQPYHVWRLGLSPGVFPETERYYDGCLSLPIYPGLSDEDVERVVAAVKDCLS